MNAFEQLAAGLYRMYEYRKKYLQDNPTAKNKDLVIKDMQILSQSLDALKDLFKELSSKIFELQSMSLKQKVENFKMPQNPFEEDESKIDWKRKYEDLAHNPQALIMRMGVLYQHKKGSKEATQYKEYLREMTQIRAKEESQQYGINK